LRSIAEADSGKCCNSSECLTTPALNNFFNFLKDFFMKKIIVLPDELQMIIDRLDKMEEGLIKKQMQADDPFLDNQEFLQLMNISKRTAQTWRDEGVIPFSQIGSKIYYLMSDVKKLLDKNYYGELKSNYSNKMIGRNEDKF
jgi:Helix-turn-helix domain